LLGRFALVATVPLVTAALIHAVILSRDNRIAAEEQLALVAKTVGLRLGTHLDQHRQALIALAGVIETDPRLASPRLTSSLAVTHRAYPGFLTLLAADRHGQLISTAPARDAAGELIAARHGAVADHDYVRAALATGLPFISPAFRGRGFGTEPVVALSAPVRDPTGAVTAVIAGALDLAQLRPLCNAADSSGHLDIVLLDAERNIVFSNAPQRYPTLSRPTSLLTLPAPATSTLATLAELPPSAPDRDAQVAARFDFSPAPGTPLWSVIVLQDASAIYAETRAYVARIALAAVIAGLLALLFSRRLAAHLTAPIEALGTSLDRFTLGAQVPSEPPRIIARTAEIARLWHGFYAMAERLERTYLKLARSELELRQANTALSTEVAHRTAQLASYRDRLELALDSANTCTWDNDFSTGRLLLDARWSVMLGGPAQPTETTPAQLLRLVHPADRQRALAARRHLEASRDTAYDVEQRVRTVRGEWLWINSVGRVISRDAHGRLLRLIGTNTDITARKRTEAQLLRQKDFFATLQQTTLDLLARRELPDVFQTLITHATRLLRAPVGELFLREDENLVICAHTHGPTFSGPLRIGRDLAPFSWRAFDTRQPVVLENYAALADPLAGPEVRTSRAIAIIPILLDDTCVGLLSLGRTEPGDFYTADDLSHCTLLAQMAALVLHHAGVRAVALRDSEARARAAFDQSPVINILAAIPSGALVEFNAAGLTAFGYTRDELIGQTSPSLRLWVDPVERLRYLALLREQGTVRNFEARMRRRDGTEFPVLCHGCILTIAGQPYSLNTLVDITARRQAEEERAKFDAHLRHTQKMESLGTLAGGIAHDFNNILTGILGYTDLTRLALEPDHAAHESLDHLHRSAERARELVRQILAFSRASATERIPHRLHHEVAEALQLLRSTLPAMVELERHLDPKAPLVLADPSQIHQVVMNLCTNAWHALPPRGGRITVTLAAHTVTPAEAATHHNLVSGPCVRLSIADTGCGMSPATLEHIFEPFFTTKEVGKGTGLGLAVVHGIMKTHEGAITVESTLGTGTTFHLYFPLTAELAPPPPAPPRASLPRGDGQRLLFVDDDEGSGQAIELVLASLGYQVVRLDSPRQALALFSAQPADFALALVDLAMPGLPGDALAEALLALRPDFPVVMLTGFIEPAHQTAILASGVRCVLGKPPSIPELARTLAAQLPGQPTAV
jgi:PAS domain S-box-containing protein